MQGHYQYMRMAFTFRCEAKLKLPNESAKMRQCVSVAQAAPCGVHSHITGGIMAMKQTFHKCDIPSADGVYTLLASLLLLPPRGTNPQPHCAVHSALRPK
jgi:hypothetical protein